MYHGKLQIAVCQLECHPALKIADIDFLREPFMPRSASKMLLSNAARANIDVRDLQEQCKKEYLEWHIKRLESILQFLSKDDTPPNIVVFPEGSIPVEALQSLRDSAILAKMTIFAGTHTFSAPKHWQLRYKKLGLDNPTKKQWEDELILGKSILPIFNQNDSVFRKKAIPSIFEISDGPQAKKESHDIEILTIEKAEGALNVLPLICSEALQLHTATGEFQLAVICSYDSNPSNFEYFIKYLASNQKVIAMANDGLFGGSGVFLPVDKRTNMWWWSDSVGGRLEKGDGIVRVEVNFNAIAPQVGVSNPAVGGILHSINAITYANDSNSGFMVSKEIKKLRENKDNTTQAEVIGQLLEKDLPIIQRMKLSQLHRLAQNHTADDNAWVAYGKDCTIGNIPSLRKLEEKLAKICADKLTKIVQTGEIKDRSIAGDIALYIGECSKMSPPSDQEVDVASNRPTKLSAIIDRQEYVKELISFINDEKLVVFHIGGINAVGKTSIIQNAIEQSGHRNVYNISLVKSSTPSFIWASLLAQLGHLPHDAQSFSIEVVRPLLADLLPRSSIIVLENAHYCLEHHSWRDSRFTELFGTLFEIANEFKCKLIIETAVEIPLDFIPPNTWKRCRIPGLEDTEAMNLLKQHLRRVGLNPRHYSNPQYIEIVKKLGGHPGAIILASEYIEQSSIDTVLEDIRKRKGKHPEIVRKIIRELNLSEDEYLLLALLSRARRPIPASTVMEVAGVGDIGALQSLYQAALIERHEFDHVLITELLRDFADLPPLTPEQEKEFHEAAAKAFAILSTRADLTQQIEWMVESKYHAIACGKPQIAPSMIALTDGAIAAVKEFLENRDFDSAKPIIDNVLKTDRSTESLDLAAEIYANLGLCDEAIALAKEAKREPGGSSWIFTKIGGCALYFNRIDVAKTAISMAKTSKVNVYFYVLEGRIFLKEHLPDEAIRAFKSGVDISEHDGWPHFYLGRELLRKGEISDAIDVLEEGEKVESNRWRPRSNLLTAIRTQLGIAYLLDGNDKTAESWLKLVAEDPSPEVARAFACIRLKANKGELTEKVLADLDPKKSTNRFDRCQIYLFRGLFYLNAGLPEKASSEFSRANQCDPRNLFVLLRWAESLIEIARDARAEGDRETERYCAEQANTLVKKVLEFDSGNKEALKISEKLFDEFNIT